MARIGQMSLSKLKNVYNAYQWQAEKANMFI